MSIRVGPGGSSARPSQLLAANVAVPAITGFLLVETANTGGTVYTNFTGGVPGQQLTVVVKDTFTTFGHGATIKLNGSVNWVATNGSTLTLVLDPRAPTIWREVGRMTA